MAVSDALFKAIVQHVDDPVAIVDAHQTFVYANPSALEVFGYTDMIGMTLQDFLAPEEPIILFNQLQTSETPVSRTVSLRHHDGHTEAYDIHAFSINENNERFVVYRVTRVDTKLKASLKSARELSYKLVENMPDAILFHKNGVIVHANPATIKLLKAPSLDALIGMPAIDLVHPDDIPMVLERIKITMSTENHVSPIIEEKLVALDGSIFYAEVSNAAVIMENEHLVLVMVRDVTKEKLYKEELESLNQGLQDKVEHELAQRREQEQLIIQQSKLAALGEMIGAIAHQWRQPLNALSLNVQDTLDAYQYGEMNERYLRQFVDRAMKQINYMSTTIDDFRNYFKTSKTMEHFELRALIHDVLGILDAQLKHFGIKTHLDDQSDGVRVLGYENELKQVLIALLNNAKDAIEATGRRYGNIYITLQLEEGRAVISLADDGSGINPEILDKIFNPYFTTKEQGKGIGIGLYMAKTIIEQNMHGSLKFWKESGHATGFRITLPLS